MEDKQCLCKNIAQDELDRITAEIPHENEIAALSEFFKVFGDPNRLRILYFLSKAELCVTDLASIAGMQQSAVSHQLKTLRQNRLVKLRKDGVTSYYSLDDLHVSEIFLMALTHIKEL